MEKKLPPMNKERGTDIWEKVYHTDARVTAMEGQLSDVSSSVGRIEQHLLNKPPVNIVGWIGVFLTLVTFFGGTVLGLTNYIELVLEPVRVELVEAAEVRAKFADFKGHSLHEFGTIQQWKADTSDELEHQHERLHYIQDQISGLEKQTATNEEAFSQLNSKVINIDEMGSRRWIEAQSEIPQ